MREKKKLLLLKRRVRARWDLRRGRLEGTHVYRFMYSWGVNASSPCSFSRMPRSFTMPFCSCAKEGGGQIALARGLRRIRVGLRSRGKRARSAARRREPREYRRVPRGRACMKSHPSSRLMTLRSFIIPDARASRSRCVDQELALSPSRYEISGSDAVTSSLDTLCRVSRVRRTTGTPSTRVVRRTSEPRQLARCFTVAPGGRARPRTRLAKTHVTRTRALGFRAKAHLSDRDSSPPT